MTSERSATIGLPQALRWGLAATLVSRLILIPVGYATQWLIANTKGGLREGWIDVWLRWDASHLLQIAEHGYFSPDSPSHAAAFFPLFPLVVRPFLWIGMSPGMAGLLISAVASVFAFAYLYRLTSEEYGDRAGTNALFYLAFFPTSVFLIAPYSESLFLAGALAAFYYARKGEWGLTVLPTAIATGARVAGLFLVAGLFFEFIRQREFRSDRTLAMVRSLALGLIPAAMYIGYLARRPGGYRTYFEAQKAGWGRSISDPISALSTTLNFPSVETETNIVLIFRLEVVGALLGLGFIAWALWKKEWGYAVYMGGMMAAMLLSQFYFSIPRMLLTFFPAMVFLAAYTRDRPLIHGLAVATLAPLATMGVIVFNHSDWFF